MNSYAEAARRRKAEKLLTAVDKSTRASGKCPIKDGEEVAAAILIASSEWWSALAESAGCKVPSSETITLIAGDIRRRTRDYLRDASAFDDDSEWPIT
jgi:hypothetical protein